MQRGPELGVSVPPRTPLQFLDTMNIFITWSGPRRYAVAEALKEYLPLIVNDFTPWLSKENIDKGAYWGAELTSALANS